MWFGTMSHIKTIEDLNTSVDELASLMNDTFTCCVRNYDALLPYIGKKETNFKIYHKLVQVNILLNKLSEEIVGLRVEFLTVSYGHGRETILSGGMKKRKSDVLELGKHETKSIQMEEPFSNSRTCCTALTSETGINMKTENLVLMDSEGTSHTQVQKNMHRMKSIKTEVQDSNDFEDLLVSHIGNSESFAAQTSCDTIHNGEIVSFAGDEESTSVADELAKDTACVKPADMITQRKNVEECFLLQRFERETSNQEKCEDTDSVFNKDHGSHRGLGGEADNTSTSFSHQARRPFTTEEPPFAFTACNSKSDNLLQGRLNKVNKEKKQAPGVQSWEELCNADDELHGVIRHQNGKFKCTLCNYWFVSYKLVRIHVKGNKHKEKRIPVKKNRCNRVSKVSNNRCESELVKYKVVHGLVKGKLHQRKQITAKDNCTKESEITHNSCENKHVNYQVVHGRVKGETHKRKQITAKDSCTQELEITSNSCKNEHVNYQLVHDLVKGKPHKRKQITAKNNFTKESEITSNSCENGYVNYQVVRGRVKQKNYKRKRKTGRNICSKESEVTTKSCENKLVNHQVVQGHAKRKNYKRKQITTKNSCDKVSKITNNTTQWKIT